MTELCDCPEEHYRTVDGRCAEPSIRSEDSHLEETMCGCCMANCPDVHAEP